MAPGGSACKEVFESHMKFSNYDLAIAMPKVEKNSTPVKTIIGSGERRGMASSNGVHELLECPVCTNLMYPPIHQVCFQSQFFSSFDI